MGAGHSDFMPRDKSQEAHGHSHDGGHTHSHSHSHSHGGHAADADANESAAPAAQEVQAWLAKVVKDHPVLLFMKGTPEQPQCGFSRRVVQILQAEGAAFASADVLASPPVREGLKIFSEWPTFPQLYIAGKFVGGADIAADLHQSGELKKLLQEVGALDDPKAKA